MRFLLYINNKVLLGAIGCMCLLPLHAEVKRVSTKRVVGTYQYVAGDDVSPRDAKAIALQRAQLQAVADEFGTIIANTTYTRVENVQVGEEAHSKVQVRSLGSSDVLGEWVHTLQEPEYTVTYHDTLGLIVNVRVEGLIRERVDAGIDIRAFVLRNGTTDSHKDDSFNAGDQFYLSFQAPTKGYLAVYLVSLDTAFCLIPYQRQEESVMPIKKDKAYIFFSERDAAPTEQSMVDEYTLTCGRDIQLNRIYVLFSPNEFTKAIDIDGAGKLPRYLPFNEFHRWLGRVRTYDRRMTCKAIDIDVHPK